MKLAAVAFYGFAAGLLAVGLRELLTGFEENRCSMTYMFEYPEYRVSSSPARCVCYQLHVLAVPQVFVHLPLRVRAELGRFYNQ